MQEKNGLDNKTTLSIERFDINLKEKKKIIQKIKEFVKEAPKCNNFCYKQGKIKAKIYFCKSINKKCIYINCPKIKNNY